MTKYFSLGRYKSCFYADGKKRFLALICASHCILLSFVSPFSWILQKLSSVIELQMLIFFPWPFLEVLKQVWDLSDQDSDSMLSLREFCFALYLMERYREGRPLPAVLPRNVMFDETLLSMTSQPPNTGYGNAAWGPGPGIC